MTDWALVREVGLGSMLQPMKALARRCAVVRQAVTKLSSWRKGRPEMLPQGWRGEAGSAAGVSTGPARTRSWSSGNRKMYWIWVSPPR